MRAIGAPTIVLLALACCALLGAATAQDKAYRPVVGPLAVAAPVDLVLHDAGRNKDLPVRVVYPVGDGPFPVVVFSHGAGGMGAQDFPLTRYWAECGYVVLQPTHDDSIALRRRRGEDARVRDIVSSALTNVDNQRNRPLDVIFLLDSLAQIERRVPDLKGKMDAKRIGVSGHSFGAFTTQAVGGATVRLADEDKERSFSDARPAAFLLLSGQGPGQFGLSADSWRDFRRPMMAMTGSRDRGAGGQGPQWKLEPFRRAAAGDKYGVLIEGANHGSFPGRSTQAGRAPVLFPPAENEAEIFSYIKMATIAFWDAYLKDSPGARAYLQSDALPTYSAGGVWLEHR